MRGLVSRAVKACLVVAVGSLGCGGLPPPCRYGDSAGCPAACHTGNDAPSCTRLGAMYETGNLAGGAEKAVPEYLRACLLGDGLGCHIAGLKFLLGEGVQRDEQRAARSFDAACTLDYADGCAMKGAMLASERPPRTEEAHALYKKGCRYGGVLGCRLMGEAQQGTESDRREYLGLACARGDSEACGLAKSVSAAPSSSDAPALSAVPPPSAAPAPSRAPAPSASGSAASQLRPPP